MQLNENLIIAPIRATKSGQPGPMGPAGPKGEPGKDGLPPEHQWVNTHLRFRQPDGRWGNYTDLKGPQGEPGIDGSQMEVEDESGTKRNLDIIKYNTTDRKVSYDPSDRSLSINCVDHSYQLDWTVNNVAELPTGPQYLGAVVYVKNDNGFVWYDGANWKSLRKDDISAAELFNLMENGTWGDAHLNGSRDKIVIDVKNSFLGVFASLSDLEASPLKKVNGKSFAIVEQFPGNPNTLADLLYVYNNDTWASRSVNGNFLYNNAGAVVPVTHLKEGDNVTMNYDAAKKQLTINSTGGGGGGGPVDLSKYVKGENVRTPASSPNDWLDVSWDEAAATLELTVPRPNFERMNAVLVAGDNIQLDEDQATGLLKINANCNVDLAPYVRGTGIEVEDGITAAWDATNLKLTLGYTPSFLDVENILEAGKDIQIVKGTGEKAKINYNGPAIPDLTEYAKKDKIVIPSGYWGTTEIVDDEVRLKIGLTNDQIANMFYGNGEIEITADAGLNKVKFALKDLRTRIYNALTKSTEGKTRIIEAGKNIRINYNDTQEFMTIDADVDPFKNTSIIANLPLKSTWDDTNKVATLSLDSEAFVNITDSTANVKATYDSAKNKIAFNVDKAAIPTLNFKKDNGNLESLGTLQINNAGGSLVIGDDPVNTGKKIATLTMPDVYQVTGHANNKDQKMTDLTFTSDVDSQVVFNDGRMTVDLTKGYYVGKVANVNNLPVGVANKSYGFVTSPVGYVKQYMHDGNQWSEFNPLAGIMFGDGTSNQVITKVRNNGAVSFTNGELIVTQTGMVYKDGGADKALHSLEVTGTGVSATYNEATQALKLDILGGSGSVQTPLKVKVNKPDGSISEFADTREIVLSGDVSGITGTDIPHGGKTLNLPIGIIVEQNATTAALEAKYVPAANKGKMIFSDNTDVHLRKWFGCDGANWIELTSKDFVDSVNEITSRLPAKVKKTVTTAVAKDKTSWTFVDKATPDAPEYTRADSSKVRVAGFLMNMVYDDNNASQVFYPTEEFDLPQYRSYDSSTAKWKDWVETPKSSGGGGGGDVNAHNLAEDAHEAIMLPAVVATMQTTWWELDNPSLSSSRTGNIPLLLLSDSTGRADIMETPSASQFYSVIIPRTGRYKMKLMFQITGATTAHGDLKFSILKNDTTQIKNATSTVSTAGEQFDGVIVKVDDVQLNKGDRIAVVVSYTGASSWDERQKKLARIDPMKNYLVIEHVNSNSGSQIARTFRNTLGGFCAKPGYGACVAPDQIEPTHAALVEVIGTEFNTKVVTV